MTPKYIKNIFICVLSLISLILISIIYQQQVNVEIKNVIEKQQTLSNLQESNSSDEISTNISKDSDSENNIRTEIFTKDKIVENQGFTYKINSIDTTKTLPSFFDLTDLPLREDDILDSSNTFQTKKQFLCIDLNLYNSSGQTRDVNVGAHKVFLGNKIYELYGLSDGEKHLKSYNFIFGRL